MKYILTTISFFFIIALSGTAQNFSYKTNEIHIDASRDSTLLIGLPFISWEYPRLEYTNSQDKRIEIRGLVSSESLLSVVSVSLIHEGQELATREFSLEEGLREYAFSQNLNLKDGENKIVVTAENTEGGRVSSTRSVLIGMDAIANAVSVDRKDYALLIGTDKYDIWNDLVNPVYDANTLSTILTSDYGFETEVIENPNLEQMTEKIREYALKNYKPQDQLFIFFAGHGHYDDVFGEGYVVARDSRDISSDKSFNSYLSYSRLRDIVNNLPCEHIFIVLDVCYGGTFDQALASNREVSSELTEVELVARKLSYKTRKYLTSGGKEYVSDGVIGQHSPFARKVIESLKATGGTDRIVTIREIVLNVENLQPQPRSGRFGDDEDLSDFMFIKKQ